MSFRHSTSLFILSVLLLHWLLLRPLWSPRPTSTASFKSPPSVMITVSAAMTAASVELPKPPSTVATPAPKRAAAVLPKTAITPQRSVNEANSTTPPIDQSAFQDDVSSDEPDAVATPTAAVPAASATFTEADYAHNPAPPYPALSRRYREQGVVELRVLVNPQGRVDATELKHSSGFARLDQAALKAVKQWQFMVGAERPPMAVWIVVPLRFSLNKEQS